MFSGFGQGGFAVLGQALESLGQIVAPMDEEDGLDRSYNANENDEEEEGDGFDNHIRNFIEQRRREIEGVESDHEGGSKEPPSPTSSLVDVALDDDSIDRSHLAQSISSISSFEDQKSISSSSLDMSNNEVEKQAQKRYREQLEKEIKSFDHRYHQLELQMDRTINVLQAECESWKQKAQMNVQISCERCPGMKEQLMELETEQSILVDTNRRLSAMLAEAELQSSQAQEQMQSLKDLIVSKTTELQKSEDLRTLLSEQLANERQTVEVSRAQAHQYQLQVKAMEEQLLQLQQQKSQDQSHSDAVWKEQNQKLSSENQTIQHELDQCKQLILQLEGKYNEQYAELDRNRLQLASVEKQSSDRIQDLERQLSASAQELQSRAEKADHQHHTQVQKCQELEKSCEDWKARYQSLQEQHDKIQHEMTISEQKTKNFEKELARLKDTNQSSAKEVSAVEKELEDLHQSFDALSLEKAHYEQEAKQAKSQLGQYLGEIQRLNAILLESEERLKQTEEIAWQNKAEAGELLWAYQTDQTKLQDLQAAHDKLQLSFTQSQEEMQHKVVTNKNAISRIVFMVRNLNKCVDAGIKWTEIKDAKIPQLEFEYDSPLLEQTVASECELLTRKHFQMLEANEKVKQQCVAMTRNVLNRISPPNSPATTTDSTSVEHSSTLEELEKTIQTSLDRLLSEYQNQQKFTSEHQTTSSDLSNQLHQSKAACASLEEKLTQSSKLNAELTKDIEAKRNELKMLRDAQHSNSKSSQDQLQELKSALTKAENDNKNLQVVITQLRQAGRAKTGEAESVQQEVQTLRQHNMQLSREVEESKKFIKEYEKYPELMQERNALLQQVKAMESTISDMKRSIAILEKDIYAKTTGNEILLSEQRMIKQESQQLQEEISNLQEAMEQMQSEHRFEVNHYKSMIQDMQQKQDEVQLQKFQEESKKLQVKINDLMDQLEEEHRKCEDQELLRRQAEISFHQEKKKMQSVLENALNQLRNSSHDVVDRLLIANLIATYFKRRRSREVMELIAKVLCFDDDQLVAVGLKVPPMNIFSSLVNTVLGPPAPAPVEGDNLAELWVNFLINQTDESEGKKNNSQKTNSGLSSPLQTESHQS